MKNLKLSILGLATMFFALVLNFKHAFNNYGIVENALHVEVLAQTNYSAGTSSSGGTNAWYDMFSQGLTKDEREEKRECPTSSTSGGGGGVGGGYGGASGSVSGGTTSSQSNSTTRYEYICPIGTVNCTPVDC